MCLQTITLCLLAVPLGNGDVKIDLTDWPIKIGSRSQLFVDDFLVARRSGVEFTVHRPEKQPVNPLLVPTPEWERLVLAYGSVLREPDSGRFRMWYTNDTGIAYAESPDGIKWEKPPVGMTIGGVKTNVLTRGHRRRSDTLTVFLDPDQSDPARKYLAYVFEYRLPDKDGVRERLREGLYLRTSPDGIHWNERPEPVMYSMWRNPEDRPPGTSGELGDVHHISWDPRLGKFMGHVKLALGARMRGLTESNDGLHWDNPRLILKADELDRPGDQLYSMIAFPYESAWLAYLGLFHAETDERLDIQLATSRDGRHWSRPHRTPFMANGPDGAWDWGVLHMAANPPLRVSDKLYIYYGGYETAHNVKLPQVKRFGIGLATLRPDGFVSVDAGDPPGQLTTRPLRFQGRRLALNATVGRQGAIRVGVLHPDYSPVPGFEADACLPVTGDSLELPVRWNRQNELPGNKVHCFRLRFELKNASLFSFRISEE